MGGVVVSCMSPARRATVGFIWSVRLSQAKPSRNSRGSGPQQPVACGWWMGAERESDDSLGALLASEIGWVIKPILGVE